MPFFLPVRIDDTDQYPGFSMASFPEYDALWDDPDDGPGPDPFGPMSETTKIGAGPFPESLAAAGVEDPRPMLATEPDVLYYVADDGTGGGGYFAGFDLVPLPIEIPYRRFLLGTSGDEGAADQSAEPRAAVFASTIFAANSNGEGELEGLTPAEWLGITRLRVGEATKVGGGAGELFTVKRVSDAKAPLVSPDARFRYPESRSPEEEYDHSQMWNGSLRADERLGWDAEPWSRVLALQVGETYRFPGNDHVSGGLIERVR
jgi:hypothetical protein